MLWAVQCDVGRVDLAALGKCGSRIGLVSARASSACEVPVELAGGPSFKLVAILVTAVRVCPGIVFWREAYEVQRHSMPSIVAS